MKTPISLRGVGKRYGATVAVRDLALEVGQGEVVALIGPSGSGKSTILRLVAGFERPETGSIVVGGRTVVGPGLFVPAERRGVGMVFQDYALFPHLTVGENVRFGLQRMDAPTRARRVAEVLALVGLADLGRRYPHQLSGGQQQRVALARALAPSPAVLLMDEPLSNLDPDLRDQMRLELGRILRATGSTAILVTHDQQEAFLLADRVAVLGGGRIQQVAPPEEIYHRPTTRFVADFVGEADFLPARGQGATLSTEVGEVPNPGLPPGSHAELMVRPDDVELEEDPNGALILEREFRGDEVAYALRLPSGLVLHSHLRHGRFSPGQRVRPVLRVRQVVAFTQGVEEALHATGDAQPFHSA